MRRVRCRARKCSVRIPLELRSEGNVMDHSHWVARLTCQTLTGSYSFFLTSSRVNTEADYAFSTIGARYKRTNPIPAFTFTPFIPFTPLLFRLLDNGDQAWPLRSSCTFLSTIQFLVSFLTFFLHFPKHLVLR